MEYKFFIGKGDAASRLVSEMLSAMLYSSVCRDALIEKLGAANLIFYPDEADRPQGFIYNTREDRPGLKLGAAIKGGFTYFPDNTVKEGKELAELLSDSGLRFDQEVWLLKSLNITGEAYGYCEHCRNAHAVFKPRAFRPDRKFEIFLKIPAKMSPCPELPEWFREVKESEWLAAQGK